MTARLMTKAKPVSKANAGMDMGQLAPGGAATKGEAGWKCS
jgi:hypothetical protein